MTFNSINRATILGRLGRDPEIRRMHDGKKVCTFSVATSTSWMNKSGEKQEITDWHNIVVFNEPTVNFIESYVKKGSKVYIEGKLKTRKWTDKKGNDKYTTEIIISGIDSRVISLDSKDVPTKSNTDENDRFFSKQEPVPCLYDNPDIPDMDDFIPF